MNKINIEAFLPKELRLAKLYVRRINERGYGSLATNEIKLLSDYRAAIKTHLETKSNDDQAMIIRDLLKDKHCLFIDKNRFDWIKNDRIIFYIWGIIKIKPFILKTTKNQPLYLPNINTKINESRTLSEMKEDIINYIDDLPTHKESKVKVLDTLKKSWYLAYVPFKKTFSWLNPENEEQCEWAWEYTKHKSNICSSLSPVTSHEYYSFIHIAFDLWDASYETKKIFMINITKANNQRNFRRKSEPKRCLNTYIDGTTKEKLNYLTKIKKMKINETIEFLIETEYNRLINNT